MAQIKVTNNSARLHTNVGGERLIPGESVTVDAKYKADLTINGEIIEGLQIEDIAEDKKPAVWGGKAAAKIEDKQETNE